MNAGALRHRVVGSIARALRGHPGVLNGIRSAVRSAALQQDILKHTAARVLPQIIQPDPKEIFLTLTANCNLRCKGCRYGRDFMPGSQLPWPVVRDLLDDCKQFGINSIRLYGGEPLLHRDLPKIVEHAKKLGLHPWLTTNGILLKEKIDELYDMGLRDISVGYYGTGEEYDAYVQRKDRYTALERGVRMPASATARSLTLRWAEFSCAPHVASMKSSGCGSSRRDIPPPSA
jgi:cyclic pyranopterin phosphate synthase